MVSGNDLNRDNSIFVNVSSSTALIILIALLLSASGINTAKALPSFARQTGQSCGACHTDFPGLTPFGRRFKLGGYTLGGGDFRTTPFPLSKSGKLFPAISDFNSVLAPNAPSPEAALKSYAAEAIKEGVASTSISAALKSTAPSEDKGWVPPVSMMAVIGLTHTQAPQDPAGSSYKPNDNVVVSPISFFYGGAISEHVGAFAQVTYNAPGMGAPAGNWTWDNIDVRYANTTQVGGVDVIYGVTANNNPTVQDAWNTTPAWGFPYVTSNLMPTPATKTLLEGALSSHVGSVGGYLFINDMLYLEASGYQTISPSAQGRLGTDPFGAPGLIRGTAPYLRVAFEPHWGSHWFQVGAFGMQASINPWMDSSGMSGFGTFGQKDKYTDVGVDSQYQYQGTNYWITLRGSYIHEDQKLDASSVVFGSNPTNQLNTYKAYASLAFGDNNRVVLTGQYFDTRGTPDIGLYGANPGFRPNSNGYIAEIAYIPFGSSNSPIWPWANARIGLQYTFYNKFNGNTLNAKDNNTMFLHAWVAY